MNPRIALGALALVATQLAHAQAYPSRPVKVIVPLAAAGTGDTLARVMSEEMAKILKQPFVVENRPGSGSVIGTEVVAKAPADGYSLLLVGPYHVINPILRSKSSYDALKDFEPVMQIANTYQLLLAHPSVPANSIAELVAYAKKNPGKLNYGSAGSGSATHLNAELFKLITGTFIVHVPYRGSTQSRQDLVAGEVQLSVDGLLPTLPLVRAGKLKALALTATKRSPVAPEIPTMAEAGVPGYTSDTWYVFAVASGTPKDIVTTLHAAAVQALRTPGVSERLTQQGAEPVESNPATFRALWEREQALWAKVIKAANVKAD
jgi:tripartite-type tricarboxylate transporter receptor subunit TctC